MPITPSRRSYRETNKIVLAVYCYPWTENDFLASHAWVTARMVVEPAWREVYLSFLMASSLTDFLRQLKDFVIRANMGLVGREAKRLGGGPLSLSELEQAGCEGLLRGLEKFDATLDIQFSTYARWWVQAKMLRALTSADPRHGMHLPSNKHEAFSTLKKVRHECRRLLGHEPNDDEIVAYFREKNIRLTSSGRARKTKSGELPAPPKPITEDKVREIISLQRQMTSSLDNVTHQEDERTLYDRVSDRTEPTPEDYSLLESAETEAEVLRWRIRNSLTRRFGQYEAEMFCLRAGLDSSSLKVQEVARRMNSSRDTVRKIYQKCLGYVCRRYRLTEQEVLGLHERTLHINDYLAAKPQVV